jgi:hypothetical protein
MSTLLINCTFRVIQFLDAHPHRDGVPMFVAVAWNYGSAVLMSTTPHQSYTAARAELDRLVSERGCALRWFDGEYVCDGKRSDEMRPAEPAECQGNGDREADASHAGDEYDTGYPAWSDAAW